MSRYRLLPTPAQEAVLRDHCTHARYVWNLRKAGRNEGFRIVGRRGRQWEVRRLSGKTGEVWVPKAGWVRFRWSRTLPSGVRSYRVTLDRAGRWHIAFAAIPEPIPAPDNGQIVGVDRGVDNAAVNAAKNIAAGHAVTARGGDGAARPVNREPQLLAS